MDRRNSKGSKVHTCKARATIQYANKLQEHIQYQVMELTSALHKMQRDLCLEIEEECRNKLKSTLCDHGKCEGECQGPNARFENDDGFPKKSKLDWDFKVCMRHIQTYGRTKKFDFSRIFSIGSQAKRDSLVKERAGSGNHEEDSEDCFEFVDSVECLIEEGQSVIPPLMKAVDDSDEVLERASCCSADSFDVVPNECCMNDSVCTHAAISLPGIVPLPKQTESGISKDGHTTFHLPNLRRDRLNLLARIESGNISAEGWKGFPSSKEPHKSVLGSSGDSRIHDLRAKLVAVANSPPQESDPNATEEADDIQVISSTSEPEQETPLTDKASEFPHACSNPSDALQDSFKPYLQKKDLKAWVYTSSEPRANSYEDWVFRAPNSSSPVAQLSSGLVFRESAGATDAFYRQLRAFIA